MMSVVGISVEITTTEAFVMVSFQINGFMKSQPPDMQLIGIRYFIKFILLVVPASEVQFGEET